MRSAALLLVCCCACLGGKQPRYDYFVLTSTFAPEPAPTAGGLTGRAQPTVSVSQVTIPHYLDRESIVTRIGDYRVVYSKQERWAEPLDEGFSRTLRQDLAAKLAPSGITVPSRTGAPSYDLQVDILRFERRGTDRVELWARWTLRGTEEAAARTDEARIEIRLVRPDSAAAAAALSQAVARLANDIAAQVQHAVAVRGHERRDRGT